MGRMRTSNRPYLPDIKVLFVIRSLKLERAPVDVVPVNPDTVDEWKYPPYSGHYDGTSFFECDDVMLTAFQERGSGGVAAQTTKGDLLECCQFLLGLVHIAAPEK